MPEHFDRDAALARWKQKLATMTARGFMGPVFVALGSRPPLYGGSHLFDLIPFLGCRADASGCGDYADDDGSQLRER